MKKRIGLIIQGPLVSIGKTGEQYYLTLDELNAQGGAVKYDCRENINRLIREFGHLFDEIVISTLANDARPDESFEGAKLIFAPDPGGLKNVNAKNYKENNKFKQYASILNGLLELEKSGMDYAVKVRVDTHLDLKKLVDSFLSGVESGKNPQAVYVPLTHERTYLIHDLYFASTLEALKKFCEAILAYDHFEFISSAHMEAVLKHAYGEYRHDIGVPDWAYFPISPLDGISSATRKIFHYMLKNVYLSLDPDIFRFIEWRGSPFPRRHIVEMLEDTDWGGRKFNIPALFATDWEHYFRFREQVSGRRAGFFNKALIKVGSFGWRAWRRIGNVFKLGWTKRK